MLETNHYLMVCFLKIYRGDIEMIIEVESINSSEIIKLDLSELSGIDTDELAEIKHEIVVNNSHEAAIKLLRSGLKKNIADLENRTFDLVRSHFDSIHWYECMKLGKFPLVNIDLPFNRLHYYGHEELEYSGDELWNRLVDSFQEVDYILTLGSPERGENILDWLLTFKYETKVLPSYKHLQLESHKPFAGRDHSFSNPPYVFAKDDRKEKLSLVAIEWLEEKITFERTFLKDYFLEVDLSLFDKNVMDRFKEHRIARHNYPENFYEETLASLNL